jgi:hypothetical protein
VLGLTPTFGPIWSPPPGFGSGNLGTPWERMHRAYVRNACRSFASCAAVGLPPLGWRCAHAWAAFLP